MILIFVYTLMGSFSLSQSTTYMCIYFNRFIDAYQSFGFNVVILGQMISYFIYKTSMEIMNKNIQERNRKINEPGLLLLLLLSTTSAFLLVSLWIARLMFYVATATTHTLTINFPHFKPHLRPQLNNSKSTVYLKWHARHKNWQIETKLSIFHKETGCVCVWVCNSIFNCYVYFFGGTMQSAASTHYYFVSGHVF